MIGLQSLAERKTYETNLLEFPLTNSVVRTQLKITMMIWMVLVFGLISVAIRVEADDYNWGSCPKVEPVPDFNFEKVYISYSQT